MRPAAQTRILFLVAGFWAVSLSAHQLPPYPSAARPGDQQNTLSKLHQKYNDEHNPVHKAKLLARLGDFQVADAATRAGADDYSGALDKLQEYRDEIEITHSALLETGVKPALKSDGFNQLQMSLRENLRRIHDIVVAMPASHRSAFLTVQEDLEAQNQKMLDELFPTFEFAPAKPLNHP